MGDEDSREATEDRLLQALDGLLVVKIKRKNPKRLPQFQGVRRAAAGSKRFYPLG